MGDELLRVLDALRTIRCSAAASEEELHAEVMRALAEAGLDAEHEAVLGPRCRIDFMVGPIGIEVKKSRPVRAALIRQLTRYAACERVKMLLVIAPRGVNLPKEIGGKRIVMMALERLWGIALP